MKFAKKREFLYIFMTTDIVRDSNVFHQVII